MGELFGTPAHPLLVHIPIVLLPLLAVFAIVMAARPTLRRRFGWVLLVATSATTAVIFWATEAGNRLRNALQPALGTKADRHLQLGNQTAWLASAFCVGALFLVVLDRWYLPRVAKRTEASSPWAARSTVVLACVVAIVGVVTAVWVIRTGHEGASITWDGVNVGG